MPDPKSARLKRYTDALVEAMHESIHDGDMGPEALAKLVGTVDRFIIGELDEIEGALRAIQEALLGIKHWQESAPAGWTARIDHLQTQIDMMKMEKAR